MVVFICFYLFATLWLVPIIAPVFGRTPLPINQNGQLQPLNKLSFLLNRHYVKPTLKKAAISIAEEMNKKFPGTVTHYLDANFPFFDGFPLWPHKSHNDGNKIDFSFFYRNAITNLPSDKAPSFIGYGISEEPRSNEENMPQQCATKGYWQYSLLMKLVPQRNKQLYQFDADRMEFFLNTMTNNNTISTIFLEPHLIKRLGLKNKKLRFHGCGAVRHDDHVHIQL